MDIEKKSGMSKIHLIDVPEMESRHNVGEETQKKNGKQKGILKRDMYF